jgi:hypothetical protein
MRRRERLAEAAGLPDYIDPMKEVIRIKLGAPYARFTGDFDSVVSDSRA